MPERPFQRSLADLHPPGASGAHEEDWRRLVAILLDGGVALLPTDTVYGLHARWDRPRARHTILRLKGRPEGSALLCLVAGEEMLERVSPGPHPAAFETLRGYWPGALTMVLPAGPEVPPAIQVDGTIGVRWPADPFLADLLRAVRVPLLSTSANPTGGVPAQAIDEVPDRWKRSLDAVVDGGRRPGVASTLVRAVGEEPELLRAGALEIALGGSHDAGRRPWG